MEAVSFLLFHIKGTNMVLKGVECHLRQEDLGEVIGFLPVLFLDSTVLVEGCHPLESRGLVWLVMFWEPE